MNPASELRLRDIATSAVLTVVPDLPLRNAIQLFVDAQVSCLVVTEDVDRPVGIITERDLLRLVCAGYAEDKPVRSVMSAPLLTVREDMDFSSAQALLANRAVRHLVLVDEAGRLRGVASETDFRRHLGHDLFKAIHCLGAVMDPSPDMVPPEQPLARSLELMASARRDHLVIGRDGRAEGILTERDVPRLMARQVSPERLTIGDVMSHPLYTVGPDITVAEAARRMGETGLRHLVVLDDGGRMLAVISQHRMLERLGVVMMEESRSRLENTLDVVLETTGVGTWEYDHRSDMLSRSRGLAQVLGLSGSEIHEPLEQALLRLDPGARLRVGQAFRGRLAGSEARFAVDYQARGGDGQLRWLSVRGRVVERDAAGQPVRSAGVAVDIDAQKASEAALRASETRFRQLIESLPLPISLLDADRRALFMNRQFTTTFGYTMAEAPDLESWWALAYPDPAYRARVRQSWDDAVRTALATDYVIRPSEYTVRCKDGSTRIIEISGVALGELLLATFFDVTEHREQQQLLEFSNAVLRRISLGVPVTEILEDCCRRIEARDASIRCTALIVDKDGHALLHGAGHNMAASWRSALETAQAPHPGHAEARQVSLPAGPEADALVCWTFPVVSREGPLLGLFALCRQAAAPTLDTALRQYVDATVALAAVALERAGRENELRQTHRGLERAEERLHAQLDELRRWQQVMLGREGRVLELKREVNALHARLGEPPRYPSVDPAGEHP